MLLACRKSAALDGNTVCLAAKVSLSGATRVGTFLCRQLADVHGLIENFNGESESRGERHLSLLEVLLQHGDGCLRASRSKVLNKEYYTTRLVSAAEGRTCVGAFFLCADCI